LQLRTMALMTDGAACREAATAVDCAGDVSVDLGEGFALLQVERRMRETPVSAHVRGLFFNLALDAVAARSPELEAVWRWTMGSSRQVPFRFVPTRECIRAQATAAVLLEPKNPGQALREMWAAAPSSSRLLRAVGFLRSLVSNDPWAALAWLERNRGIMCDYGAWRVERTGPCSAIFHYLDEYIWIEHAHRGGVEGTLSRCGVSPVVSVDLDGAYDGRLRIRWD
jgi:uncharacterized protein (TIGR02265 family)